MEEALEGTGTENKLYLQSMAGPNVALDLSAIDLLPDEIINKAVVEITVEEPLDIYPPVSQVLASHGPDSSSLRVIQDIILSSSLNLVFGGELRTRVIDGVTVHSYEFNITTHLNNIIDGDVEEKTLIISALQKAERPNRSILYGPKHPEFPVILKLITTKP